MHFPINHTQHTKKLVQKSHCKERIRVFFYKLSNLLHFLPSFIIFLFSPQNPKIIYFSIFCCFFSFQLTYISFEVFLCLSALVFCLLLYWYYFWGCWPIWDRCGKRDSKGSDLWSLQTCERERRQREHEAKMERQRQIEADRNKKALDRALAPPWVKVKFHLLNVILFWHKIYFCTVCVSF